MNVAYIIGYGGYTVTAGYMIHYRMWAIVADSTAGELESALRVNKASAKAFESTVI